MSAPRRWLDDPDADPELKDALRQVPRARSIDVVTRRRLSTKIARASALPAVAAGWLFVKSATAALGVVLGAGAVASYAGIVELSPRAVAPRPDAKVPRSTPRAPAASPSSAAAPESPEEAPVPALNPAPSLPVAPAVASNAGTLSLEAALLEQARREMRSAPAVALSIAGEHAQRYPRGQLAAERTLIQIEALHRLGRDAEAVRLARGLVGGTGGGLYAERVHKLLGDRALEP